MTEADLAKVVVEWLREMHWTVYQEVRISYGDCRADIVAVQNNLLWTIEVKKCLSLDLLDQAYGWVPLSHYVSVAIPKRRRGIIQGVAHHILKEFGIGLIQIKYGTEYDITETIQPTLHRKIESRLLSSLNEAQQTYAQAGNANSKFWTPFKQTCQELRRYVSEHPGCSLKDCIDSIKTHYHSTSTARSCMAKWLRKGIIEGIEIKTEGKFLRLHSKKTDDIIEASATHD